MGLCGSFGTLQNIHDIAHGDPAHLIQERKNLHLVFIEINLGMEFVVNLSQSKRGDFCPHVVNFFFEALYEIFKPRRNVSSALFVILADVDCPII